MNNWELTAMNMRNQNSNDKCLIKNDYHNARKYCFHWAYPFVI